MAILPWVLHMGIAPEDAGGALWTIIAMAALAGGNPIPAGGAER